MENFLKVATNRNSLKSIVKDFYLDELEKFLSNLTIIMEQRKAQEDILRQRHKHKIEKIQKIKLLLSEQGLSVDDLIGDPLNHISRPTKAKKKILPKYRLIDLDGGVYEWTGRGLAPKEFRQHFDRGHSKESCLIIDNIEV